MHRSSSGEDLSSLANPIRSIHTARPAALLRAARGHLLGHPLLLGPWRLRTHDTGVSSDNATVRLTRPGR